MLSANALAEHRLEAANAGADRHLAKPINAAALIGAIRETLAARRDP
jgi:CheY-like chemotaxis protein